MCFVLQTKGVARYPPSSSFSQRTSAASQPSAEVQASGSAPWHSPHECAGTSGAPTSAYQTNLMAPHAMEHRSQAEGPEPPRQHDGCQQARRPAHHAGRTPVLQVHTTCWWILHAKAGGQAAPASRPTAARHYFNGPCLILFPPERSDADVMGGGRR